MYINILLSLSFSRENWFKHVMEAIIFLCVGTLVLFYVQNEAPTKKKKKSKIVHPLLS